MIIAITSTGDSLESNIDLRFGRCSYFAFYNTESKITEFVQNTNNDAKEGAGPASVQLVALRNVSKIVSYEFGMKIKPLLESLKIQMVVIEEPEKKIKEIIEILNHKD